MIPIRIPSAIEYARGINMIVIKPGIASLISSKLSSVTDLNIIRPRMMRIGAVAAAGKEILERISRQLQNIGL